jgi:hypothetical protein
MLQYNVRVVNVVDVSSFHPSTTDPRILLLHRLPVVPSLKPQSFLTMPVPDTIQPPRCLPPVPLQHLVRLQALVPRTATTRHGLHLSHLVLSLKPELGHRSTTINMMTFIEHSSTTATMPTVWSRPDSTSESLPCRPLPILEPKLSVGLVAVLVSVSIA